MSLVIHVAEAYPVSFEVTAVQVADASPVTAREEMSHRIWEWAINRLAYDDDDRAEITPLRVMCLCAISSVLIGGTIWLLVLVSTFP